MRAARCARASSGGPVDRRGPRPSVTVGFEARCRRHGGGLLGLGLGLLCPVLAGPPGGHLLCGYPIVLAAPLLGELHRVSRTLGECALAQGCPRAGPLGPPRGRRRRLRKRWLPGRKPPVPPVRSARRRDRGSA